MPLKVERRKFKDGTLSKTYWMRGTVAGAEIFRSTKKDRKSEADLVALNYLREHRETIADQDRKLFIEAAEAYIANGGEDRYILKLLDTMGAYALDEIDQVLIDEKSRELYPGVSAASLVRWFYTPVVSVLNFSAKRKWCAPQRIEKPAIKAKPTQWAEMDWFKVFWAHCDEDLYRLTVFLPYTGCRATEALNLVWERVDLKACWAYIPETKNNEPRTVNLPPEVIEALKTVPPAKRKGRVFPKWSDYRAVNHAIRKTVKRINEKRKKNPIAYLSTHKIGSHTYGTWMRRDVTDIKGLVDTGRWKDLRSAARYTHTTATEASQKSNLLPRAHSSKIRAERKKSL